MKCFFSLCVLCCVPVLNSDAYEPSFPYPGGADATNTTAIFRTSPIFTDWANGYTNMIYGEGVGVTWQTPEKALGAATADVFDIVSLGRGGEITLSFPNGISDGNGFDFAVFENGISDNFLELAWVEVSSDGTNFVRFPNFSIWDMPIGPYGSVFPEFIQGFAGKYRKEYGTPFDLAELQLVQDAIDSGTNNYTASYIGAFTSAYASLDVSAVQFVRIVDVIGDGNALDSKGQVVYDPYDTIDSVGFDLEAVGVINAIPIPLPFLSTQITNDLMLVAYDFNTGMLSNDVVMASTNLAVWNPKEPLFKTYQTNGVIIHAEAHFELNSTSRFFRVQFDQL